MIAIPLGIAKAIRHNSLMDKTTALLLLAVSYAIPVFIACCVAIGAIASVSYWQIFPLQGLVSENFDKLSALGKSKGEHGVGVAVGGKYYWRFCRSCLSDQV